MIDKNEQRRTKHDCMKETVHSRRAIDLYADLFFPVIANGKRKANNTCI